MVEGLVGRLLAAMLMLVLASGLPATSSAQGSSGRSAREARILELLPPKPPRFFFRVQASVTFDGAPYAIDVWIACGTYWESYGEWPRGGYRWVPSPGVQSVGVRTADGGALFMRVPIYLCARAAERMEKLEAGEPDTPPLSQLGTPPDYLPFFYWFDDAGEREVVEAYLSARYYDRVDRRLTIERVAIGSFVRELPEGTEALDIRNGLPDPFDTCELVRPYARDVPVESAALCPTGYAAFPIVEPEWRLTPGLAEFLDDAPDDRLTPVPVEVMREHPLDAGEVRKQLGRYTAMDAFADARGLYKAGLGIPRLEETVRGRCPGLLREGGTATCQRYGVLDEMLPIDCDGTQCRLIEDAPGVFFLRPYQRPFPDRVVNVGGTEIPLANGEYAGWYDPSTRTLWWVAARIIL